MKIQGLPAIVTGAASGLGAESARELARRGAKVAVLDLNEQAGQAVAAEIGGIFAKCDVTSEASVEAALAAARAAHGPARIVMNIAGIGRAKRLVGRDGKASSLDEFKQVVNVNLFGSFNVARLAAAEMIVLDPLADNERGMILFTSSIAAYDGQVGQAAYSASKGAVASMTLPLARDLAQFGVRVMTIAPGLFLTPLLHELPQEAQESLAASIPFPKRLGQPIEFARLAAELVENAFLNGEVIRLDGALRMAPR